MDAPRPDHSSEDYPTPEVQPESTGPASDPPADVWGAKPAMTAGAPGQEPPVPPGQAGPTAFNPLGEKPKRGARGCLWGCGISAIVFVILVIAVAIAGVAGLDLGGASPKLFSSLTKEPDAIEETVIQSGNGKAKIVVIDVYGMIYSGTSPSSKSSPSGPLINQIEKARKDPDVKAVVLDMNTPGGEVTATDEAHHALQKLREDGKPVVTCMRAIAASGGYYLAAGTDHIVANRLTLTGSVGVIIGGYNYAGLFDKLGLESELYIGGEMKDVLNMARERTPEEIALIQGLVDETYGEFVKIVAAGRLLSEADIKDQIGARIFSGAQALDLKLVDQLGYFDDAIETARQLADIEEPAVVRYGYIPSLGSLLFGMAANDAKPVVELLPEERRLVKKGQLYFLTPIAY